MVLVSVGMFSLRNDGEGDVNIVVWGFHMSFFLLPKPDRSCFDVFFVWWALWETLKICWVRKA